MLQVEFDPTPSPNIHIFLPSGVAVIGIDSWVERFTKLFQNVQPDPEAYSSEHIIGKTWSPLTFGGQA